MPEEVSILLSADKNYARSCAVTILSVLENSSIPNQLHFYILSPDIDDKSLTKIQSICERSNSAVSLLIVDINSFKEYQFSQESFNPNKCSRLLGPNLCKQCQKILYLDCDLIVIGDVAQLFEYNLQERVIGAVPQVQFPYQRQFIENFGLNSQETYFNSGILLIDAERWRNNQVTDLIFKFIDKYANKFHYNDQDALNAIFWNNYCYLPGIWNVESRLYKEKLLGLPQTPEIAKRMANPKIVHYTGSDKPWSSQEYVPARSLYAYYSHRLAELTGWFPSKPEPQRASVSSYLRFAYSCLYFRASFQAKRSIFTFLK